jgi:hypothetical protein
MLVACRLAGLSALEVHYVRVRVGVQLKPLLIIHARRLVVFGRSGPCR